MTSLLPPNATKAERAIETALSRIGDIQTPARLMWSPDLIPAEFLPWLAWALSVDDWDPDWSDARKREVIRASIPLHRIKGTRASVQMALETMGYGDARIVEDRDLPRYGKGAVYGRTWVYGPSSPHWADYWVEIDQPIDKRSAEMIAARLSNVVPARCRLRGVQLAGVLYAYGDGLWTYGTSVTYGGFYQFGA